MEAFPFYDTAGGVKQVMEVRDRHAAAIASEAAALHYGAVILQAGIEDKSGELHAFFPGSPDGGCGHYDPRPTRSAWPLA